MSGSLVAAADVLSGTVILMLLVHWLLLYTCMCIEDLSAHVLLN